MASTVLSPHQRRFALALAASVAGHALAMVGLQWLGLAKPSKPPTPPALQARLLPRPDAPPPPLAPPSSDPVLKDSQPAAPPTPPPQDAAPAPKLSKQRAEAAALRKLSRQVSYPPEAIAQGLEGEVRVLVALDESGKVVQAKVVVSSGKDVLDKAAVAAVYGIGRIPDAGVMDFVLPVIFKLE